jgi:hypothetical protein
MRAISGNRWSGDDMTKLSPQQLSASRVAVSWWSARVRPSDVCVRIRDLGNSMYNGLVAAGVPSGEAGELALDYCCLVLDELVALWNGPEDGVLH